MLNRLFAIARWYAITPALLLSLSAATLSSAPTAIISLAREPYLQQVTSTSATIVWATKEAGQPEVRFAAPGGAVNTAAGSSTLFPATSTGLQSDYYQHVVQLSGLAPSTTYEYDVLVNGVDLNSQVDTLKTAPSVGSGTVTFVAFGDSGTGSTQQQQIAARLTNETFDFAVHGGDLAYGYSDGTGGATHQTMNDWFFAMYRDWLRSRAIFPSMGNHDSRSSNAYGQPYLDVFTLPRQGGNGPYPDHAERYYSFDYGPVHVVVLDTELAFQDVTRRDAQLAWLDADLGATTQPWKIAVFHRSPYSAGGEHGSDLTVRSAFGPLFDKHGVRLVISAHEHVYERTVPMRAGQPDPTGTVYIVSGGGGGPLYPAGTGTWTAYSASVHHYVKATATECSIRLDTISIEGATIDGVALDRCGTTPPTAPSLGNGDILLYASDAGVVAGNWVRQDDPGAAGGRMMRNPDKGAAKKTAPLAAPADYFELSFTAQPNVPYRLWMRGKADGDVYYNDSAFVQFTGTTTYAIGTTSAAEYNLEDCSGCRVSGWGWQDNGWGVGVLGPTITFTSTGPHRIRVQPREDGLSIDQIMLSPQKFLSTAPGALKDDTTIYPRSGSTDPAPAPEPAPSGLPSGWSTQDIGAVGLAGSASAASGTFTVEGAGQDIWGSADAFRYVWQPISGDVDVVARVASVEYVQAWVKAGVMIRERLTADSPHALMLVSAGKGLAFQRRLTAGGLSASTSGGAGTAPAWVKLSRRGNTITASRSADGVTWTVVGTDTFAMAADVYVGLAVSSHDSTQLATAAFDNVSVTGAAAPAPSPSWSSQDIGAVGAAGGSSSTGGAYSVAGSGADIWGTADAFHYMWQRASGDFDLTTQVTSVEYVNAWVKAGVMIRERLTADSPHALMLVSPGKGLAFQRRIATGGLSAHTSGGSGTAPAWVRLERRGNTITAYRSADGVNWTPVGSDTFTMGADVYVGLAVSSHVAGTLATATFDHLSITPR